AQYAGAQRIDEVAQCRRGKQRERTNDARFVHICRRQHEAWRVAMPCEVTRDGKDTTDRADRSVEAQLAKEHETGHGFTRNDIERDEQADRDWQIEAGARLLDVAG